MGLRDNLFLLRDKARMKKIEGGEHFDDEAFKLIHDSINLLLNRLPQLTISMYFKASALYQADDELRSEVKKRIETVENCSDDDLRAIFGETNNVIGHAFIANMGGWFIYIIPGAFLFFLLVFMLNKISVYIKQLILMPVQIAEKLAPLDAQALTIAES